MVPGPHQQPPRANPGKNLPPQDAATAIRRKPAAFPPPVTRVENQGMAFSTASPTAGSKFRPFLAGRDRRPVNRYDFSGNHSGADHEVPAV
jgi:hypothetical protein